jgi:hypothetical protein
MAVTLSSEPAAALSNQLFAQASQTRPVAALTNLQAGVQTHWYA